MNILQNMGKAEILTAPGAIQDQLNIVEQAGRVCWRSEGVPGQRDQFIRMLINKGHESVLEHSALSVRFYNISRGFTHEMVRHRNTAFSQRSTRYVDPVKGECMNVVAPPTYIGPPTDALAEHNDIDFSQMAKDVLTYYKILIKNGWKPEDARQILPIGIESEIVVTANFREWRHIFTVRCQKAAHWEIRGVMCGLLALLHQSVRPIFDDFHFYTTHKSDDGREYPNVPMESVYAVKERRFED